VVKPLALLRCIGVAVLKAVIRAIPLGEAVADLAHDVYTEWSKERRADDRRTELQEVAQAAAGEVRAQIQEIVRDIAGNQPTEIQESIKAYLHQVPSTIHQSLRRPSDPTGTTLPPSLHVLKEEDLIPFLPAKLPRFKPGDRPLPGVDWELTELLGVGGFGEVWKARNPHFDSVPPVALKFCLDPAAKDRLLRHEAAVLNQVMRQGRHAGIIPLLRTYLSADPPCLEYQYVEGGDLGGFLAQRPQGSRALPIAGATTIILRLAKTVGYAHRLTPPIVHRDLKPANILLEKAPDNKFHLRIADFGIGGLAACREIDQTKRGMHPGELMTAVVRGAHTLLYASPQQIKGMPPDPRDDVHALGVIWYQLLIGDLGAGRPGGRGWRNRLAQNGLSAQLIDLLETCFEDNPEDRPADAAVLAEELQKRRAAEKVNEPKTVHEEATQTDHPDRAAEVQHSSGAEPPPLGIEEEELFCERNREAFPFFAESRIVFWRAEAEQGSPSGQRLYGRCLMEGIGVAQNTAEAVQWLLRAAEQGHAPAQLDLAMLYEKGEVVEEDYATAVRWYGMAAEQGSAEAQYELGCAYENGWGVEQDITKAIRWYVMAAKQGHADSKEALFNLFMFLLERGDPGDEVEAFHCLRKAAELGFIEAQIALGYRYANGHGLPQDDDEAARWNRMAAEQGSAEAQYELGCAYENGWGVELNTAEAIRWYGMAAKLGDRESAKALKRLLGEEAPLPQRGVFPSPREESWKRSPDESA
jgi:TPR repeat protein